MVAAAGELTGDRLAILGLWSVPGIGPRGLAALTAFAGGSVGALLDVPPGEWAGSAPVDLSAREELIEGPTVRTLGQQTLTAVRAGDMRAAFPGDEDYPASLGQLSSPPAVLFVRGKPDLEPRRFALVGSRGVPTPFLEHARAFAARLAALGGCVVSGAADGVDRACHLGALDAGGHTWAFLGSALDAMDPAQAKLQEWLLPAGGVLFSELPPGVHASRTTFPRRNRLIAGAAESVLVLRARERSGSLYTAEYATGLGRPVFALPAEPWDESAHGSNALLNEGLAVACYAPGQLLGLADGGDQGMGAEVDLGELSREAQEAYLALGLGRRPFEQVLGDCQLASSALTSALCELELWGLIVQLPGKIYEKVKRRDDVQLRRWPGPGGSPELP